jgi:hypothetical protein
VSAAENFNSLLVDIDEAVALAPQFKGISAVILQPKLRASF